MFTARNRRILAGALALLASTAVVAPASASPGANGPFTVTMHTKTADGRYLQAQVWTMQVDGSDLHQQFAALEEENDYAVWSPDGAWLAFHRSGELVVARADGSDSRIVAQAAYGRISWSPDGSRLVFSRGEDGGDWSIWMVGADGTDEHEVYRGAWAEEPAWSPRGDRIAFVQQDPGTVTGDPEVFTMSTDGTDLRQVTFNDDPISDEHFTPVIDSHPAWSPDGERLAVVSDRDAPVDCHNCPYDLYVSDVDGGNIQRIALDGNEFSPTWAPDGTAIAYVHEPTPPFGREDPIWFDRYDLSTGKAVHLHSAESNSSIDWGVAEGSVPLADLRTTVSVADDVQLAGSTTTVTAVLTNDGPRTARDATVELRLPPGVRAAASTPTCSGTTELTCALGAVSAGDSRTVVVDVALDQPGLGEVSARATSTTADPDVLDNRSSVWVTSCTQLGGDEADVLVGTDDQDVLCGGAGADQLDGSGGDDLLVGGPGDDALEGGSGHDTTSYAAAAGPVRVDLAAGTAQGEGNDALGAIEGAAGSRRSDVLLGSSAADVLLGGAGNDRIDGGSGDDVVDGGAGADLLAAGAGDDRVRGGTGTDTVSFSASARGVTVDLAKRKAAGEGSDRLGYVEGVRGSSHRDVITGSVVSNLLRSGDGRDEVRGLGGNDRVDGGASSDDLTGGDGFDRLVGGSGRDHCDQQTGRGLTVSCES